MEKNGRKKPFRLLLICKLKQNNTTNGISASSDMVYYQGFFSRMPIANSFQITEGYGQDL